ncbi:MAG: hypothetical protein COA79_10715 [Planctomycetota bacterium]|nr:MAG: hypothetical protein COA79_10715 [Planctomycetota bacterium]
MHPYIKDFINTNTPINKLLQQYCDSNQTIEQMRQMQMGLNDSKLIETTYLEAEKYAETNMESDPFLLYAFYAIWVSIAESLGRYDDLKVIYERSKNVCAKPPSVIEFTCAQLYYALFKPDQVREYTKNIINHHYDTCPRFEFFFLRAIISFSAMGEMKYFEDMVKRLLANKLSGNNQWYLEYSYYVNDICTGKLILPDDRTDYIERENKKLNLLSDYGLDEIKLLKDLFTGKLNIDELDSFSIHEQLKVHLKINNYLINNKLEEAIIVYEKNKLSPDNPFITSFFNVTELRLKLSNGEYKSARNILLNIEIHHKNYFGDFYRVRIFLLEGDMAKAIFFFKKLYKNCLYYDSLGLLDLELNASLEIGAKQIRILMSSIKDLSTEKEEIIFASDEKAEVKMGVDKIIGESQSIKALRSQIKSIANINMPILISGETGVGKDLVANAIHEESTNSAQPFLPINCGAILDSLLLSELYGHEKGAFTGAIKSKKGIFEMAKKGVVFLDEIGEISASIQVALLRSLESSRIRPVGSARDKPYLCRIISATNKSLEEMVQEKTFREDLFYRIRLIEIKVPSLRSRSDDIIPLINHFLLKYDKTVENNFNDELTSKILKYNWPGNIRQLKSEVEKLCLLNHDKEYFTLKDCELLQNYVEHDPFEGSEKNEIKKETNKNSFDQKIEEVIVNSNFSKNRITRLKKAFKKCPKLSRRDVVSLLEVSSSTADKDLKILLKRHFIEKVMPTAARRTHYYQLIEIGS